VGMSWSILVWSIEQKKISGTFSYVTKAESILLGQSNYVFFDKSSEKSSDGARRIDGMDMIGKP